MWKVDMNMILTTFRAGLGYLWLKKTVGTLGLEFAIPPLPRPLTNACNYDPDAPPSLQNVYC